MPVAIHFHIGLTQYTQFIAYTRVNDTGNARVWSTNTPLSAIDLVNMNYYELLYYSDQLTLDTVRPELVDLLSAWYTIIKDSLRNLASYREPKTPLCD